MQMCKIPSPYFEFSGVAAAALQRPSACRPIGALGLGPGGPPGVAREVGASAAQRGKLKSIFVWTVSLRQEEEDGVKVGPLPSPFPGSVYLASWRVRVHRVFGHFCNQLVVRGLGRFGCALSPDPLPVEGIAWPPLPPDRWVAAKPRSQSGHGFAGGRNRLALIRDSLRSSLSTLSNRC